MEINLHFHEVINKTLVHKIDRLTVLMEMMIEKENIMSKELDRLTEEVAQAREIQASAIALIQGLAVQIADLKDDPVALQALADSLDASSNALADAIVANTPVVPEVVPE